MTNITSLTTNRVRFSETVSTHGPNTFGVKLIQKPAETPEKLYPKRTTESVQQNLAQLKLRRATLTDNSTNTLQNYELFCTNFKQDLDISKVPEQLQKFVTYIGENHYAEVRKDTADFLSPEDKDDKDDDLVKEYYHKSLQKQLGRLNSIKKGLAEYAQNKDTVHDFKDFIINLVNKTKEAVRQTGTSPTELSESLENIINNANNALLISVDLKIPETYTDLIEWGKPIKQLNKLNSTQIRALKEDYKNISDIQEKLQMI